MWLSIEQMKRADVFPITIKPLKFKGSSTRQIPFYKQSKQQHTNVIHELRMHGRARCLKPLATYDQAKGTVPITSHTQQTCMRGIVKKCTVDAVRQRTQVYVIYIYITQAWFPNNNERVHS